MRTSLIRFLPIFSLLVSTAHANLTQPSDGPYVQLRRNHTLYVYDPADRDVIPDLVAYTEAYRAFYDRTFRWKLDEEQDLILLSANSQVANAFATQYPNVKSFWYGAGAEYQERFAIAGWLPFLAAHETSHLYQMNAKSRVGSAFKTVFGNATYVNPLVVPVVLRPNEFLPTSFAEGNAVLNESRVGLGGRLFSGEIRALVLRLSAGGQIDATRLINEEFKFPFGQANYYLGGYFQAHLAGKYGIEKTNSFFLAHGQHWLNPFRINATFRAHFGASFYQEVREFTRGLELLAERQRTTPGAWLAPGVFDQPLNHDADKVWWLSSPGYRTPSLWSIDKATGEVSERRLDTLGGKVFFEDGRPRVAASNQNDLHHVTYGLYEEHAHLAPEARGEIVTDVRAGHRVGFSARDSWRDPHVVLDGEPYDVGHSNPALDPEGHVYYFRQVGDQRHLYRDRQLVARLDGRYSKLTEIDAGVAYFVGATPYGSSLFRFDGTEITRVLDSDAVVDARRLNKTTFVVEEFDASGVHVVLAEEHPRPEKPAVYAYPFASEPLRVAPVAPAERERAYSGWRELRFGALSLSAFASSYFGLTGTLGASFSDPLEFNDVRAQASYSARGSRRATAQYTYSRFLPHAYVRHTYGDLLYRSFEGHRRVVDQETDVGVRMDFWRHDRWDAAFDAALVFAQEGARYADERPSVNLGLYSLVGVARQVRAATGLYPWRRLGVNVAHRVLGQPGHAGPDEQAGSVTVDVTHGFDHEFYLAGEAQWAAADDRDLEVGFGSDLTATSIGVPRLAFTSITPARTAGRVRLEGRKVLPSLIYDARIPLGLNRVGVVAAAQAMALGATGAGNPNSIFEYGYGIDAEVLVAHQYRFTTRILLTHVDDARGDDPADQITLGVRSAF